MKFLEFYQEDPGSNFTHNGRDYLLNPLIKFSDKLPIINVPVDKLKWVLEYGDDERDYMADNIDISVPILIARYNDKLVVIDGFHRLKKAIKLGKKKLPAKFVSDRLLSYFEI